MEKSVQNLCFPLEGKYVAMLAPSFVVDFAYPKIILQMKDLGFDKVVELTFGAKMINREYHKVLEKSKKLAISSVCPGIVETVKNKFPHFKKNLIGIDSPMVATAKICKKIYPGHKTVFISPCDFKRTEALSCSYVDYVIDYMELAELLKKNGLTNKKYPKKKILFDKFYNDFTKVYPLSGGLFKTAHLRNILKKEEAKIIDGAGEIIKFLENPKKEVRFLDVTFCKGGCIGGPKVCSSLPIESRRKKVLSYMELADKEKIPAKRKGLVWEAEGINFLTKI